jgi:hypothetical protein
VPAPNEPTVYETLIVPVMPPGDVEVRVTVAWYGVVLFPNPDVLARVRYRVVPVVNPVSGVVTPLTLSQVAPG